MNFFAGYSAFVAWVKIGTLGQFDAEYRRTRRLLHVTTPASLSNRMRSVSICVLVNSSLFGTSARMRSMST